MARKPTQGAGIPKNKGAVLVPVERVTRSILVLRRRRVLLDLDLAEIYDVSTGRLNEAVKRNAARFPEDFMFQLTEPEAQNLRSQFAISSWGGRRYLPFVFTEYGAIRAARHRDEPLRRTKWRKRGQIYFLCIFAKLLNQFDISCTFDRAH